MIIHGRLQNGRLSDITYRMRTYSEDVPLLVMPTDPGPWSYDTAGKRAVPAPLNANERLDRQPATSRLIAAMSLRLSSSWSTCTPAEQALITQVLDSAGASTLAALRAP